MLSSDAAGESADDDGTYEAPRALSCELLPSPCFVDVGGGGIVFIRELLRLFIRQQVRTVDEGLIGDVMGDVVVMMMMRSDDEMKMKKVLVGVPRVFLPHRDRACRQMNIVIYVHISIS